MSPLPPFPLKNFNLAGDAGTDHKVSGQIAQVNSCPEPLTDAEVHLTVWYLIPEGDNWLFPQRTFTSDNYYAGYDKLVVGTNVQLVQGQPVAKTKVNDEGLFTLKWKEVVTANRTPYLKAHHIRESNFDPSDPTGYREITVKRVYKVGGLHKIAEADQIPDWSIDFNPMVLLEFFGTETQKQLPPLTARCIPILPG
ncbi:hypothetical protein [Oscillatoria sp. FACHB-1406]|uniref:hypothetical protein n=1 Tax=Oscillatoria sp. FACHB-1406 TaxID=2692846 RepID=UPI00168820F4|nr:hypothetical protein [Oscillatoria sp. FACHB-1406]MBD2579207.1 hypothetical protein [Oscillatoria sp. FACHB-1406]